MRPKDVAHDTMVTTLGLGMAMTAKCVRYMMEGPEAMDDHGLDEMLHSEHG